MDGEATNIEVSSVDSLQLEGSTGINIQSACTLTNASVCPLLTGHDQQLPACQKPYAARKGSTSTNHLYDGPKALFLLLLIWLQAEGSAIQPYLATWMAPPSSVSPKVVASALQPGFCGHYSTTVHLMTTVL